MVFTDALNMKGVSASAENGEVELKAFLAGNDMLLMPIDEKETIDSILNEMKKDIAYKEQIYQSVKKIIRYKIVLGLIDIQS